MNMYRNLWIETKERVRHVDMLITQLLRMCDTTMKAFVLFEQRSSPICDTQVPCVHVHTRLADLFLKSPKMTTEEFE